MRTLPQWDGAVSMFFVKSVLESEIEKAGCAYARRRGWREWKVTSPSARGFPDRFYARRGRIVLVEWKQPGEPATEQQARRHRELREAGVDVRVLDSLEAALILFR